MRAGYYPKIKGKKTNEKLKKNEGEVGVEYLEP
jgi:hypothetical protein